MHLRIKLYNKALRKNCLFFLHKVLKIKQCNRILSFTLKIEKKRLYCRYFLLIFIRNLYHRNLNYFLTKALFRAHSIEMFDSCLRKDFQAFFCVQKKVVLSYQVILIDQAYTLTCQ
jgi:hypothetical protein